MARRPVHQNPNQQLSHSQSLTRRPRHWGLFFFTRVEAEKLSTADRQRSLGYKPRNPVLREVWTSGIQCQNRRCVTPFAIGNIRYSKRLQPPSYGASGYYVCVVTPFAIHLYIVNERHFRLLHVRNKVTLVQSPRTTGLCPLLWYRHTWSSAVTLFGI